jgi:hypothetical protein
VHLTFAEAGRLRFLDFVVVAATEESFYCPHLVVGRRCSGWTWKVSEYIVT